MNILIGIAAVVALFCLVIASPAASYVLAQIIKVIAIGSVGAGVVFIIWFALVMANAHYIP